MLCILPRTVVGWNSLGAARSTTVHAPRLQQRDATLQECDNIKEPVCGWSYYCAGKRRPVVIKRKVKPRSNEAELMGWMDDQGDKAMSQKTVEIFKGAKETATPTIKREAATITSGLKW